MGLGGQMNLPSSQQQIGGNGFNTENNDNSINTNRSKGPKQLINISVSDGQKQSQFGGQKVLANGGMHSNNQKTRSGAPPQENLMNGANPNAMKGMTPIDKTYHRNGNNTLQYKNQGNLNISNQSNWQQKQQLQQGYLQKGGSNIRGNQGYEKRNGQGSAYPNQRNASMTYGNNNSLAQGQQNLRAVTN